MHTLQQRRDFLKTTGVAAVGSLAWGVSAEVSQAKQPVASTARLLPGCCAYSYGLYLQKGQMTMEEFIVKAV